MSDTIVISEVSTVALRPGPIPPSWILAETPEAKFEVLARSHDGTAYSVVWECSPGVFNWNYVEDETVVILSGEVFITTNDGVERRLGPGDSAFFPATSSCKWRVTSTVKKVAILRKALPLPFSFGLRVWNKVLRMLGMGQLSPI